MGKTKTILDEDFLNKWVVLKKKAMVPEHYEAYKMFFVEGGFGAHPRLLGSKIFGHHADGAREQWVRQDVERLATEEEILLLKAGLMPEVTDEH